MYALLHKMPNAVAKITGGIEAPQLSGCVKFYQENGCVLVVANIFGLPAKGGTGFFEFHVHQGSACTGADFSGTESHYLTNGFVIDITAVQFGEPSVYVGRRNTFYSNIHFVEFMSVMVQTIDG